MLRDVPGAHFSQLKRELELATGTLQYHLKVLEDRDLVEVKRDDRYTRYFPALEVDRRDKEVLSLLRQATPRRVVLDLLENGPSQLSDISDRLDLAPSTISFHLANLQDIGVVENPQRGRYQLADEEAIADTLIAYQESFADRAVDRIVSLVTGLSPDPAAEE